MANMSIFIGNLSMDITETELRGMFQRFGQIFSATVMNDNYIGSGQSRCYGYIEMASKNDGENAICSLNGTTYRGRNLSVIEAMPKARGAQPVPRKPRIGRARERVA